MPTASDLVTDLPADFETFGQAVATSMADLLGGTTGQILSKASNTDMDFTWITNDVGDITAVTAGTGISGGGTSGAVTITNSMATAITTAGDLIKGTGSGTFDRLGIGSTGQVLTVSAGAPAWATPAASGGMTLLSTTSLTGSSVTISSISQDYKDLVGIIVQAYATNTGSGTYLRPNNSTTTSEYATSGVRNIGSTLGATGSMAGVVASFQISHRSTTSNTASQKTYAKFEIPRYAEVEPHFLLNRCYTTDGTDQAALQNVGVFTPSSAISSLVLFADYTFSGGTLYLYGVK